MALSSYRQARHHAVRYSRAGRDHVQMTTGSCRSGRYAACDRVGSLHGEPARPRSVSKNVSPSGSTPFCADRATPHAVRVGCEVLAILSRDPPLRLPWAGSRDCALFLLGAGYWICVLTAGRRGANPLDGARVPSRTTLTGLRHRHRKVPASHSRDPIGSAVAEMAYAYASAKNPDFWMVEPPRPGAELCLRSLRLDRNLASPWRARLDAAWTLTSAEARQCSSAPPLI